MQSKEATRKKIPNIQKNAHKLEKLLTTHIDRNRVYSVGEIRIPSLSKQLQVHGQSHKTFAKTPSHHQNDRNPLSKIKHFGLAPQTSTHKKQEKK